VRALAVDLWVNTQKREVNYHRSNACRRQRFADSAQQSFGGGNFYFTDGRFGQLPLPS
jgi:hypothetical protein